MTVQAATPALPALSCYFQYNLSTTLYSRNLTLVVVLSAHDSNWFGVPSSMNKLFRANETPTQDSRRIVDDDDNDSMLSPQVIRVTLTSRAA